MPVESTVSSATYAGNNSTVTGYPVPFRFDDNSWLKAEKTVSGVTTSLVLGPDFTITGSGPSSSASIKTTVAVPLSGSVYIYRETPKTQDSDFVYNGNLIEENVTRAFDKLTMATQDGERESTDSKAESLRVPFPESIPNLPSASVRADKVMGFDSSGNPLLVSDGLITDIEAVEVAVSEAQSYSVSAQASSLDAINSAQSAQQDSADAQEARDQALVAAASAEFAASNVILQGAFASAADAEAAGVKLGGSYFDSSYTAKVVAFPLGANVALMGDSQTVQNATGFTTLQGYGYAAWARIFLGSKIDFVPGPTGITFATNGFTTDQIIATHLPQVLASGARACFFMTGNNDGGIAPSAYAAKITNICQQLRNAGIVPVCISPPAIALSWTGNAGGAVSASMAALWAVLPAAVAAGGGIFVPCPDSTQVSPGSAIAKPEFTWDGLHMNDNGACAYGRAIAATIGPRFNFSLDPYDMGGTWVWGPAISGAGAVPTGWQPIDFSNSPGSSATSSIVSIGGGKNAWEIDHIFGGAPNSGTTLINYGTGTVAAGQTVDAILTLEVLTGSIFHSQLTCNLLSPQDQAARDMNYTSNGSAAQGPRILPSDGPVIIRTPKAVVSAGRTQAGIVLSFSGTAKFRLYDAGDRRF